MKAYFILGILSLLFCLDCLSQQIQRIDGANISTQEVDRRLEFLVNKANVHGLSISVITDSSYVYERTFGYRNMEKGEALSKTHNFYGASLSKPIFAFMVMRLVDEKIINLDTPLIEYLDKPIKEYVFDEVYEGFDDIEGDSRHKLITARMCLAHTSGLPNWRYITKRGIRMNNPLKIEFEPGSFYNYSGEGIQLLQLVVEQITGENLESLAREYVLDPLDMNMTSFTWQERFNSNYAVGHIKKRKTLERRKRTELYASGSMDTTPEDYVKFVQAMLKKSYLDSSSFNEMISPQIEITSKQQFGPNRFGSLTIFVESTEPEYQKIRLPHFSTQWLRPSGA